MSFTAIIPARGGSKGVPRKNLQVVGGMTLLARAIRTCQEAGAAEVVVTSEDPEIGAHATQHGARWHVRPMVLAQDDTPSWPVLMDAATDAERFAFVQCTAPLMTAGDVSGCVRLSETCDIAVACHESHVFLLYVDGEPVNFTFPLPRRQDWDSHYAISGSVWAFGREHLECDDLYDGKIGVYTSSHPMRLDIDTEEDLRIADVVLTPRAEIPRIKP